MPGKRRERVYADKASRRDRAYALPTVADETAATRGRVSWTR